MQNENGWLQCDDCRKYKEDVRLTTCPYTEEIHNEIVEVILCEDCEYERAQDI